MTDTDVLRDLLQRYSRAADDRDVATLRALFHPEATIDGARGRQSLDEWLASMAAPRTFPASMHVLGEPLIGFDGSGDAADLDTYAVVYQVADGHPAMTLGIRYRDTAVRSGGGWVIRTRRAETIWTG